VSEGGGCRGGGWGRWGERGRGRGRAGGRAGRAPPCFPLPLSRCSLPPYRSCDSSSVSRSSLAASLVAPAAPCALLAPPNFLTASTWPARRAAWRAWKSEREKRRRVSERWGGGGGRARREEGRCLAEFSAPLSPLPPPSLHPHTHRRRLGLLGARAALGQDDRVPVLALHVRHGGVLSAEGEEEKLLRRERECVCVLGRSMEWGGEGERGWCAAGGMHARPCMHMRQGRGVRPGSPSQGWRGAGVGGDGVDLSLRARFSQSARQPRARTRTPTSSHGRGAGSLCAPGCPLLWWRRHADAKLEERTRTCVCLVCESNNAESARARAQPTFSLAARPHSSTKP
jgi:hypothetical protein